MSQCKKRCDAAEICPRGTTYKETCERHGWFSSWWFWRWGSYELTEDYCYFNEGTLPSDAIAMTERRSLTGQIPLSCLASDCTGQVAPAPECSTLGSGWTETSSTNICGKESGFGVNRPCAPSKGFWEAKMCEKVDAYKFFALSQWNIEDRKECWPEKPYEKGKFRTCQASFNNIKYYEAFYQTSSGECISVVDGEVVQNPNVEQLEVEPMMSASTAAPTSLSASVGPGASLAVAPVAILGLFFAKRGRGSKKGSEKMEAKRTVQIV